MLLSTNEHIRSDLIWFVRQAKPRTLRSMRQFAEDEVVLPSGPFMGSRFRCYRQPFTALWFDEIDRGRWTRFVGTGPTQSGKTLACFVIPLMYHLFEVGETVICGLPDMDMASDKWREDLMPIIERSRFRGMLPRKGAGSRGGLVQSVQFRNGATLRFMSGGGGDKSRAGFTSRVLVITETDGMDEAGHNSREADKISQLIARTRAFGHKARIYMECTVSTESGRTWREYRNGSMSRIVLPCPHCSAWVTPEREHLVGWLESDNPKQAAESSRFVCPSCSEEWSEEQRLEANRNCRLVHVGQEILGDGSLGGGEPQTDTLGFRWSAINNMFLTSAELGADEWTASRSPDEENAERERRQFVWCIPITPNKLQETNLAEHEISCRVIQLPRGILPTSIKHLVAAIDLGKYLNHWIVVAWSDGPFGHVVDYGRIEVASDDIGVEQATMVALREFREMVMKGWPIGAPGSEMCIPHLVLVDAGYMTDVVYAFCRETGHRFLPSVGRGASQQHHQWYNRPTQTGSIVQHIGEGFHINWMPSNNVHLVEVDADHWKTWVHQRLSVPISSPGALGLFQASPVEHMAFAKHLTAEVKYEEFVAGKGLVTKWERRRKQNHWFDALYNACVAAHYCGVRLVAEKLPEAKPVVQGPKQEPDDRRRPWIDIDRWNSTQRRLWGR